MTNWIVAISVVVLMASSVSAQAETLVPNGSFDRDTTGWRAVSSGDSGIVIDWLPRGGRNGGGALHLMAPASRRRVYAGWSTMFDSLTVGRRLRVTAWVKGTDCERPPIAALTIVGPNGNLAAATTGATFQKRGDFDWTPMEVEVPIPDGGLSAYLSLFLSAAGTAWLDDVSATHDDSISASERRLSMAKGPGLLRVHSAWEYFNRNSSTPSSAAPKLLVALPLDYREQVPLTFEVSTRPAKRLRTARVYQHRPGAWVAELAFLPFQGDQKVVVDWKSIVLVGARSFHGFPEHAPLLERWPTEAKPWLASTLCAQASDPRIVEVAAAVRDTTRDVIQIIERTLRWIAMLDTRDRPLCSVFDAVQALDHIGSCLSNANLAVALLRSNGIPARTLGGYPSWGDAPLQCHFAVEAFVPGYGWYPMDPTRSIAPLLPPDQVQVSIVPIEHEDRRALKRTIGVAGLPYLSISELVGDSDSMMAYPAMDPEHGGAVKVEQLQSWAKQAAGWDRAYEHARKRWKNWLTSNPRLDGSGMIRTRWDPDSIAAAKSPTELIGRISTSGKASRSR